MHWIKETSINRLGVIAEKVKGWETFYWPVIKSQYFSEPVPLDCDLFTRLSVSPIHPQLGEDVQSGLELGISFSPQEAGAS